MDHVKYLLSLGVSKSNVAEVLGIAKSKAFIANKITTISSPEGFNKYFDIAEYQLDAVVQRVKHKGILMKERFLQIPLL